MVKLALVGLGCRSIPDLFHALRDLGKQIGSSLGRQLAQLDKQLSQEDRLCCTTAIFGETEALPQQRKIAQLRTQYDNIQSTQAARSHDDATAIYVRATRMRLTAPALLSATQVIASLEQHLQTFATLFHDSQLPSLQTSLDKFTAQIPAIASVVNTWWTWVFHSLSPE